MFKVTAIKYDNTYEVILSAYSVNTDENNIMVKYTAECECCGQTEHRVRLYNKMQWTVDFDSNIRSTGR